MNGKNSRLFNVTIAALDGAEVSNFAIHKLSEKYKRKNLLLYHDDGLTIFKNVSESASENIKKYVHKLFREYELEVTIEFNKKTVNFLEVTLNFEISSVLT